MHKTQMMLAAALLSAGAAQAWAAGGKEKGNESTATLYGSISQGITIGDRNKDKKTRVDYLSDHIRFGIKGTEALNNGMQAFFNFHFTSKETKDGSGVNGLREAYIGLKGDLGNITLGR